MDMHRLAARGVMLLGCGKMGSAMLAGWLAEGLPPTAVSVVDPAPSEWLRGTGVALGLPDAAPGIVIVAVKPQMMGAALPVLAAWGAGDTVFVSVAAGTPIAAFETMLGAGTPVVRAMPNTPAAIGQGITAIVANAAAGEDGLAQAELLLSAVGQVVRLDTEDQMDAVTGVSGSGPAYVFHLIETLAAGGVAQGLPEALAMQLAKATVAGAGALAATPGAEPAQLRVNVTSPNGTTQAALEVLMEGATGFPALVPRAVAAATERSKELRNG
ncbi:MAG: pyrroline-5-carboxylate reductase [Pseudomonadota bacterium]